MSFSLLVLVIRLSTIYANNIIASISSLKIFLMSGLKTFIATFLIILSSLIFALWTWAIEAAAIGSDKSIISSKLD